MLALSGCKSAGSSIADGNASDANASEAITITIWTWDDTFNVKAAQMAAKEYVEDLGDSDASIEFNIETREREEILVDIQNILATKAYDSLPDIIMMEDYDVGEILALYEGEFVDLSSYVDESYFVTSKIKQCSYDGSLYGLPFDSGSAALFYRIDILETAGYTEADMQDLTWERFIEIGQDVYEKSGISMITLDPTDMPLIRLMLQSCGSWYVDLDGNIDIAENEVLYEALEVYTQLLESNVGTSVNGWNEFISAFQDGRVACVCSGSWIISSIKETRSQSGLWRVTSIPVLSSVEGATNASNVGGSSWYVLTNGANTEAATDFLVSMFANNDSFIDELVTEIGLVPAITNASVLTNYWAEDEFFGGQEVTKFLMELADEIPAVNYGSKTYDIEAILEEEYQDFLVDSDLLQCLQRVQIKAEVLLR